jgi:3-oxoadipate enol-lactonase
MTGAPAGTAAVTGFVEGAPRLAYTGAGSGTPIVFLHGIGGNRTNWSRQLEVLSPDYHVIAWDARGYGDSDDYDGPLDFVDFSHDLKRLLDHLAADSAHLCGLSMGGRTALDFYDHYPARVKSLILCDTFPGFDASFTREGRERFVRERRQPLVDGKELADIAPLVVPTLVAPGARADVVQTMIDSMCVLHKQSYIKTVEGMTLYTPVTDVSKIQVPVQIIVGAEDKLTPPSISEKMADAIPDARLLVLAGTGHLSNLESPDAFDRCVLEFLDGID